MREHGLRLVSPDADRIVRATVVEHPRELALGAGDTVVLAMKSQDTLPALEALPREVTIACAQNGVANERAALRRFANVIGIYVFIPTAHAVPGVVELYAGPCAGMLDVGSYPAGASERCAELAGAFVSAGFESDVRADIMRWKYGKLLSNLGNAIEAATGRFDTEAQSALDARAREEGVRVLDAAGIAYISDDEAGHRTERLEVRPIDGRERAGGSSFQSLARQTGAIETDYLNGEIVLLGRLHGIATPINATLQRVANALARDRRLPGSLSVDELLREIR
jgi:2-dehydropantoate 2-reductase